MNANTVNIFFRTIFLCLFAKTVCSRVLAFFPTWQDVQTAVFLVVLYVRIIPFYPTPGPIRFLRYPPQMATQAAANRREGPRLQCYYRSRTSLFDLNGQGRALCVDPRYTIVVYPADICNFCHNHFFCCWNILMYSCCFTFSLII